MTGKLIDLVILAYIRGKSAGSAERETVDLDIYELRTLLAELAKILEGENDE